MGATREGRAAGRSILNSCIVALAGLVWLGVASAAPAEAPAPRARDLGVPFDGTPGPNNAITDVLGVEVGFKTLISGDGPLIRGKGPVRTGVTAIFPRGKSDTRAVFAGFFAGNGNGDMAGTHWVEESGVLETPILITGTGSVGVVRDAAFRWLADHRKGSFWYPLVAETADVPLNDMAGHHVTQNDALDALDNAKSGPVAEGNVGGGTGMVCNGFKGGTGTASRKLSAGAFDGCCEAAQARPKAVAARRHKLPETQGCSNLVVDTSTGFGQCLCMYSILKPLHHQALS